MKPSCAESDREIAVLTDQPKLVSVLRKHHQWRREREKERKREREKENFTLVSIVGVA